MRKGESFDYVSAAREASLGVISHSHKFCDGKRKERGKKESELHVQIRATVIKVHLRADASCRGGHGKKEIKYPHLCIFIGCQTSSGGVGCGYYP